MGNWRRRPEDSAWKPVMGPKDPHLIGPIDYIGLGNPLLRILPEDVHQKVRLIMVRSTDAEVAEVMETHEKKSRNLSQTEKKSQTPPNRFSRKTSESLGFGFSNGGRGSSSPSAPDSGRGSTSSNSKQDVDRRPSSDLNAEELTARRMSEAGLRRPSAASDEILNENTGNLMVGMPVWVDGTKHGRIAYIGEVHFAKGEMAGVHLDTSQGKNNGTVGGVMYFQCEPRRGVFSRLHRLTLRPLSGGY